MSSIDAQANLQFTRADLGLPVPARFEAVAALYPLRVALTGGGRRWTYDELNRHANRIARAIAVRTRPGPGCVACVFEQSPNMILGALAVLKAGKTCVSIHPGLPVLAQAQIVRSASPDLVLTTGDLEAGATAASAGVCAVLRIDGPDTLESDAPLPLPVRPEDLAVILYTSGTTGEPKGVAWSHRRLLHRVWFSTGYEGFTPDDRQSLVTHSSFANAQGDIYGALLNGARLSVFDVTSQGLAAFADWLDEEQITLLRSPAQLFKQFLGALDPARRFPSVRAVSIGGAIGAVDVERWKRHFSRGSRLLLRFSATETTVVTMACLDHDSTVQSARDMAGTPVPDKELAVVDEQGRAVDVGTEGELVVTSAYLADGYWQGTDKSVRAFPAHAERPDTVSYRTGDRGRMLSDGRFEFVGRRDDQVKIRGYRVELREVEAALREIDGVSEATVVAVKDEQQHMLVAFVVAAPGGVCESAALRERLAERLPDWKVPAHVHVVPALPSTFSGKVDRQRLIQEAGRLEAERAAQAADAARSEELDPLERAIAERWRQVMRSGPVTRSADFFLEGGDSLQATMLHLEVERLVGRSIPLEGFFRVPTVAGIAAVVRSLPASTAHETSSLPAVIVPFRATGSRTPLFIVHGRMGRAVVRPSFLEVLGDEQPVYGFQAVGLDRSRMRRNTIEEMAEQYVEAVRLVQPKGPYFLGAACAGCVVQVAMANQLRAAGERVAPLLMFDPPARPLGDRVLWDRGYRALLLNLRKRFAGNRWNSAAMLLREREEDLRGDRDERDALGSAVRAAMDFSLAGLKHAGWSYDGPVLLLRSQVRLRREGSLGAHAGFARHLTGDVRWFEAGATHNEVVRGSSELSVQQIRECVEIAREALKDGVQSA